MFCTIDPDNFFSGRSRLLTKGSLLIRRKWISIGYGSLAGVAPWQVLHGKGQTIRCCSASFGNRLARKL